MNHEQRLELATSRLRKQKEDRIAAIRNQLPQGESAKECEVCDAEIPEGRREALPGVKLCIQCQKRKENGL